MLSILICHSYFMRLDPKQWARRKPYPPLATLTAAQLLRAEGHEVLLFDAMLADGTDEYESLLAGHRPDLVLLYEDNYNFLSKMCLAAMREAACGMIRAARHHGAKVIASGSDASDDPEPYLHAGAGAVLTGEGLATLLDLIPRLMAAPEAAFSPLAKGLSSIVTLDEGRPVKVNGTSLLPEARLPRLPAWDLVDMDRYRSAWRDAHGYFSLNMVASRGCPFRCTWCAKPIWGSQYLQRHAVDVADEMTHLKRSFAPDHIWFADDIFGFRVDWIEEFSRRLGETAGHIPFTVQTRADLISERMAQALSDAGCREAWLGAESGSQRVLDAMHKGTTVAEIVLARARLRAAGIRVGFFIQLGYLGEEIEDIIATRTLLETALPDDVGVSVAYPLPGTQFHALVKEQLRGKTHWQDSDDLAMMFQGTYTSEFYREIRDLIHDQVRFSQPTSPATPGSIDPRSLEERWTDLLSQANRHRSPGQVGAAVSGRP